MHHKTSWVQVQKTSVTTHVQFIQQTLVPGTGLDAWDISINTTDKNSLPMCSLHSSRRVGTNKQTRSGNLNTKLQSDKCYGGKKAGEENNFNKGIRIVLVWSLVKYHRKGSFMLVSALLVTSYVPIDKEYKFWVFNLLLGEMGKIHKPFPTILLRFS